jgi:hypothetical protein
VRIPRRVTKWWLALVLLPLFLVSCGSGPQGGESQAIRAAPHPGGLRTKNGAIAIGLGGGFCRLGAGAAAGPIGLGVAVCWLSADIICVATTGNTIEGHVCAAVADLIDQIATLPACQGGDGASLEPIFRPSSTDPVPECKPRPGPGPWPISTDPPPSPPPNGDDGDDNDCDENYCTCINPLLVGILTDPEMCEQEYMDCLQAQGETFSGFPWCPENDPPVTGTAWGDPHFVTYDGLSYSFQGAGEYWLFRSATAQVDFAARFVPAGDAVTMTSAAAMWVTDATGARHKLSFFPGNAQPVWVDDQEALPDAAFGDTSVGWMSLPANYEASYDGVDTIEIHGPAGKFAVSTQSATASPHQRFQDAVGLLGASDGDPLDDLLSSSGAPIPLSGDAASMQQNLDSWRIAEGESPFHYFPGESWSTFQDPGFPHATPTPPDDDQVASAQAACSGVPDPLNQAHCLVDVSVTGDPTLAAAAQGATTALQAVVQQPDGTTTVLPPDQAAQVVAAEVTDNGDAGP